ncbi:glu S.griseus protease inhibitor [Canna indica]|uniref:Glu S.griseus protease inhibitor n=1 Tax=Canna indica TaxID=4628 RepID=A0AAQ3K2Q9_9LILI|nr:glu S.griseus protease inhibitor [Canna indica]
MTPLGFGQICVFKVVVLYLLGASKRFTMMGKNCWPELVGVKGEKAVKIIEAENPAVMAAYIVIIGESNVPFDFRCDRV